MERTVVKERVRELYCPRSQNSTNLIAGLTVSICCVSHKMRQYLPSVARRRVSPAVRFSAVMSTSILPVKAGAKDLVRIGADKRTTSCSPSLAVGLLIENIGPTERGRQGRSRRGMNEKEEREREGRNERGKWKEG